jgi:hypothetical protein
MEFCIFFFFLGPCSDDLVLLAHYFAHHLGSTSFPTSDRRPIEFVVNSRNREIRKGKEGGTNGIYWENDHHFSHLNQATPRLATQISQQVVFHCRLKPVFMVTCTALFAIAALARPINVMPHIPPVPFYLSSSHSHSLRLAVLIPVLISSASCDSLIFWLLSSNISLSTNDDGGAGFQYQYVLQFVYMMSSKSITVFILF